jgi:HSP20 family protein
VVKAELPGVKREDVKVLHDDGVLTIEGERKYEKEDKNEKSHRIERFFGSFTRSFVLPDNADATNIRAETRDGVLNVHIPKLKVEKAKPVQIKVD